MRGPWCNRVQAAEGQAHHVRRAGPADVSAVGRLLHDFNVEFGDPAPDPAWLAQRLRQLMAAGDTSVLIGGDGPDAVAVMRFRPSIWADALECYLAELYVVPAHRGKGLGRALLDGVLDHARRRGAGYIDLNADEPDTAARALYESTGFSRTCGRPDGPVAYYYELEL